MMDGGAIKVDTINMFSFLICILCMYLYSVHDEEHMMTRTLKPKTLFQILMDEASLFFFFFTEKECSLTANRDTGCHI